MAMTSSPTAEFSEAPVTVGDINVRGNVEGDIIIGNNNRTYHVEVHKQYGDVYNLHRKPVVERLDEIPQPPRPPRGFIGRAAELALLEKSIADKSTPAFLYGPDGLGKSALLGQAANGSSAQGMTDGVIYLEKVEETGEQLGVTDILQRIFDSLYSSFPPLKIKFDEARTRLGKTAPLVILDGFNLPENDYHQLSNVLRKSALIASDRRLSGREDDFEPIKLAPLVRVDSLQLLSAKSGIGLDNTTRSIMDKICQLCGDVPLAIIRIAMLLKENRLTIGQAESKLAYIQPPSQEAAQAAIERSFAVVYPLLDTDERGVLAAIAAAPGISVDRAWLESTCRDPQAVSRLEVLEVIQANSPRLRLADGYQQVIYATGLDLNQYRSNLISYLLSRLSSRTPGLEILAEELGNILGLLKWAVAEYRWDEVIALGRAVAPYLTLKGLWTAGQNVLKQVLLAGKKLNDQTTQAWALHQLGSWEIGAGTIPEAIKYLVRALQMRRAIGDSVGAKYTIHNLKLILPITNPWRRGMLIAGVLIITAIVAIYFFTRSALPAFEPSGVPTPTMMNCIKPEGWEIYIAQEGDTYISIAKQVALAMDKELITDKIPVLKQAIKRANCTEAERPATGQEVYVPAIPERSSPPRDPVESPDIILGLTRREEAVLNTVGQTIHYLVQITNNYASSSGITPNVSFYGKAIAVLCPDFNTVGNMDDDLDYQEAITCTAAYEITQADIDTGSVTNTAVAGFGEKASNDASLTTPIEQNPGVSLGKEANPSVYSQAGQTITYTYTVQNRGNVTLDPVSIFIEDDHIENNAGFICDSPAIELAPGETVICKAIYSITPADVDAQSVTNTATAYIEGHTIRVMDSGQSTFKVSYANQLSLNITALPDNYSKPGEVITFSYELKNINDTALSGPVSGLDSAICPEFNPLTLDETVTCIEEYTVTQTDLDTGLIIRTGTASLGGISSNEFTLRVAGNREPGLALTQKAIPTSYGETGQTVTYTYTIQNSGNVTLGPAQFTIQDSRTHGNLPFECGPTDVVLSPQNGTVTCTAQYETASADIETGSIINSAMASVMYNSTPIYSEPNISEITFICPGPPHGWVVYIIQSGDFLSQIGSYTDTTAASLQRANCLSSPSLIYPGQKIYVPPISISGTIFVDPDGDGQGDATLAGFTVELRNAENVFVTSTSTDSNGDYMFINLPPGIYYILQVRVEGHSLQITGVNFVISPAP